VDAAAALGQRQQRFTVVVAERGVEQKSPVPGPSSAAAASRQVDTDTLGRVRVAVLSLLFAVVVACPASAAPAYWLGPSFEGLPLRHETRTTFLYGDCDASEGGCAPPLQVHTHAACERNPLRIDVIPRIISVEGAATLDYGDRLEVIAGPTDVVIFGVRAQARRALDALRRRDTGARRAAPRWPPLLLAELRFTRDSYRRNHDLGVLRRRLLISKSAIRFRLALARHIDLSDAPRTRRAPGELQRQRRVALSVKAVGRRATARGMRLPLRTVDRLVARERRDLRRCRAAMT
jgi:hypothetical protein